MTPTDPTRPLSAIMSDPTETHLVRALVMLVDEMDRTPVPHPDTLRMWRTTLSNLLLAERAALPPAALREALWSVHQANHDQENDETWCDSCRVEWPCPTAEVLERAALSPAPTPVEPPVDDLGAEDSRG